MPPSHLASVSRLRPRPNRVTDALQGALDLGGWSEPVRIEINERLTGFLPDGIPSGWSFVMVASEAERMSAFLKAIDDGPRANSTLRVWVGLLPYIRRDTGEIICGQRKLADTAHVALGDVSRALARLVEMGALLKEGKGTYRVHPAFAWRGTLTTRERVAAVAPKPKLAPVE
jgi:hypothetical protein